MDPQWTPAQASVEAWVKLCNARVIGGVEGLSTICLYPCRISIRDTSQLETSMLEMFWYSETSRAQAIQRKATVLLPVSLDHLAILVIAHLESRTMDLVCTHPEALQNHRGFQTNRKEILQRVGRVISDRFPATIPGAPQRDLTEGCTVPADTPHFTPLQTLMILVHELTNAFGDPGYRVKGMIATLRDGNNAGLVRMRLQLTLACDAFAGRLLPESKHQTHRRE